MPSTGLVKLLVVFMITMRLAPLPLVQLAVIPFAAMALKVMLVACVLGAGVPVAGAKAIPRNAFEAELIVARVLTVPVIVAL